MQNANKSSLLAQSVPSKELPAKKQPIETTGDLRKFLANIAIAIARGEMETDDAAIAVKACEQINASLYSEIKSAALQAAAGNLAPQLGALRIDNDSSALLEHKP